MLLPSGSAWMTSTLGAGRGQDLRPDHRSRAVRGVEHEPEPAGVDGLRRDRAGGRGSRPAASPASTIRPRSSLRTPASCSVRQMSCSSSSSTASSSLSPCASRTLSPLSSAGLCEAETMIPAANGPGPGDVRERRRRDDPDDVDVDAQARRPGDDGGHEHVARAPRVLARRRSRRPARPGGARPPGRGRRRWSAGGRRWRPRGSRRCRTGGASAVSRPTARARRWPVPTTAAGTEIVTVTLGGLAATSVVPAGRFAVTGHRVDAGLEPGHVEVHDQGGPGQPVEVGGRAADRDEHAVGRQRVAQVGARRRRAGGRR